MLSGDVLPLSICIDQHRRPQVCSTTSKDTREDAVKSEFHLLDVPYD
jgi:hypothetical protein